MKTKSIITLVLFTILTTIATAEGHPSNIDFDGLKFSLYTDFTIYAGADEETDSTDGSKSWDPYFEFGQNHFIVLGSISTDRLSLLCDITDFSDLLEVSLMGNKGTLTVGRILIPFGDYNYHHIYGGYADEDSLFLPFFWTDYGLKGSWWFGMGHQLEAAFTNGFAVDSESDPEPVFSTSPSSENNLMKAVNLRMTLYPSLKTKAVFSFMYDIYGEDETSFSDKWTDESILLFGTDLTQTMGDLTLKGGVALMEENQSGVADTWRYGWYGEAKYRFEDFYLRFRTGGIDTDTDESNEEDTLNFNLGFIVPMGPLEWHTTYLHTVPLGSTEYGDPTGLSHELMTKLIIHL
ncbi:MAG: hypothetical protein PQJ59_16300 [Spirochaetales bacterium]|nr:hypothetical protein [Spirochaetales bacterium]